MKKIINEVSQVEDQMVDGLVKSNPKALRRIGETYVVARAQKKQDKVAVICGGGSGHEPGHAGYVGTGMLDACVPGAVFTSPTPDQIYEAIKEADAGKGVIMVVMNYTGDIMNFEMAAEMAEDDDIEVREVIVNDDVAVEDSTFTTGRRGIAGTVFVLKCAGAAAEAGKSLDEVEAVAKKAVANLRSMSMAITPCIVPAAGEPGFEIADDEMEIGIGVHGEPGVVKKKIEPADKIVDELLSHILSDTVDYTGQETAVMVNGCGATPLMELYIVNNHVQDVLAEKGVKVYKTLVGEYMTSLEMQGFSISLLKLDDELKACLDAPADTPSYKQL